jgi:hypothetical protein
MPVTMSVLALALAMLASPAPQAAPAAAPPLFERLIGHWVMTGTIEKTPTTHDVDAELVLNKGYVRLHEVSRDKDASGTPQYEAIIFISVDAKTGIYYCLWLDTTSNAGLSNGGIATATSVGNTIPFLFKLNSGEVFHNAFIYDPQADTWRWELDGESNGTRQPFARLTLRRR